MQGPAASKKWRTSTPRIRRRQNCDRVGRTRRACAHTPHILLARVVMLSAAMDQGDTRQLGKDLELSLPSTVTSVSQVQEGPSSSPAGLADLEQLWALPIPDIDTIPTLSPAELGWVGTAVDGGLKSPATLSEAFNMGPSSPSSTGDHSSTDTSGHESDTASDVDAPTATAAASAASTTPAPEDTPRCPFCGNAPIIPGEPYDDDRRPVGGILERGRYKVRAAPRKENRLAQW
jgi:hypothetical protein